MIRVRGTLSVHFEGFFLGDQGLWFRTGHLAGFWRRRAGYCSFDENDGFRKPGVDITVNDVLYGIKKDENFHRLYALIAARHGGKPNYSVTATLTGNFFAGEERKSAKRSRIFCWIRTFRLLCAAPDYRGIRRQSVPPANLNLSGVLIGANGEPVKGFTVIDDVLGGTPPERQKTVTNEQGEFAFSNSGQQLRFEDPHDRPLALTVEPGGAPIRVKLQEAKRSDWMLPVCEEINPSNRIGFLVGFTLPNAHGIQSA